MHDDVLRRRGDAGFTLVELLIAVSILGLLLGGISGVLYVSLRTAAQSETRLSESADSLLATVYFADDVASAQRLSVSEVPRCGTDARAVVEFYGQDFADDSTFAVTTTVVTYVVRTTTTAAGTTRELRRLACASAATSPTYPLTPVTDVPVVRRLWTNPPTVSCGGAACVGTSEQVQLLVRAASGGLTYRLSGDRRTTT